MQKILLVEDDIHLGPEIKKTLEQNSFQVTLCSNLSDARNQSTSDFDLVLLDWMLPDGQGIDFLKEIQSVPVIMLTARADLIDKVLGLESGASDYITKPFESRELIARIRVQLRLHDNSSQASEESQDEEFKTNKLFFNLAMRELRYEGEEIILTKMEFDLLKLLASNPKRVFSREKLLDKVWGYEHYPTTRTVDTHVLQLRQKISNDVIVTVRGIGYKFNPDF